MPSPQRTLCLLAVLLVSCPEGHCAEKFWKTAEPGWRYEYPRDHGPHREFKTEWWYATGNLSDSKGREYGIQLTFFREGLSPGEKKPNASRFRVSELPFAHFALGDMDGKTFRFFQKASRGAFGEAGFAAPGPDGGRIAWIEDWILEMLPGNRFHLKAAEDGRAIDLILTGERPPLEHGRDGISSKSSKPGHASHYYSLTRLKASGCVTVGGKKHPVEGLVWFDHEWATNSLDPDETGWDWSGLHLSDGSDLMIFRIRDTRGNQLYSSATLRGADGGIVAVPVFEMVPGKTWKSSRTGGLYPCTWEITLPSREIHLTLVPKLLDQELLLPPFAYWEGAVKGNGMEGANPISAEGYLEMTGYGGKILGLGEPRSQSSGKP